MGLNHPTILNNGYNAAYYHTNSITSELQAVAGHQGAQQLPFIDYSTYNEGVVITDRQYIL